MNEKKRKAVNNTAASVTCSSVRKKRVRNRVVFDDDMNDSDSDYTITNTNFRKGEPSISSNDDDFLTPNLDLSLVPDLDMDLSLVPDLDLAPRPMSPDTGRRFEQLLALIDAEKDRKYYLNAAFRSLRKNEVFVFREHDYFVIKYDPETPEKDCLVRGPVLLCDGFPLLYASCFHEYGVDAAFGCHGVNEAILFSEAYCAKIRYDLDTRTGDLIAFKGKGERRDLPTRRVFPFLGEDELLVDAAFESVVVGEAYLFRRSRFVLLNYSKRKLITRGLITDAFPCLRDTIFSSDIGAAFASHNSNQVYLFKDNSYVLVHYNHPRETSDSYIIDGPAEIVPNRWPSLRGLVPYNAWGRGDLEPKTWTAAWGDNGRWFKVG